QLQARQGRHRPGQLRHVLRCGASLARLGGDVDLETDIQRLGMVGPLLGEALRDPQAVYGVYPCEALGDSARLVGLEPADEMPSQSRRGRERVLFGERLLQVALAELSE